VRRVKAFVFYGAGQPLRFENVSKPKVEKDHVLVKIKASGICGTDVNYVKGKAMPYKIPIILGHEISGTVENVGKDVRSIQTGDRILVHYIISCGKCVQCMQGNDNRCRNRISIGAHVNGGFAEYISVPERNVFRIPSNLTFEEGAVVGCAASTAFHAILKGGIKPGDSVAIFGLGEVGIHAVLWARFLGAGTIIGVDISNFKLRLAKELGADVVIDPRKEDPVDIIMTLQMAEGLILH